MTISANDRQTLLSPSAGSTVLAYDFPLAKAQDLVVLLRRDGEESRLEPGDDYSFPDGLGGAGGGTITLAQPSQEDDAFVLYSDEEIASEADFEPGRSFSTAKLNASFDGFVRKLQEMKREVGRTFRVAHGSGEPGALPFLRDGRTFIWSDEAGRFVEGPSAANIAEADAIAELAASSAEAAAASAEAAQAAAGAADAVLSASIRHDEAQDLAPEAKLQARDNAGALARDGEDIGANGPALRTALQVAAAIEVKSADYTAGPSDRGKMLVFSSAATLSLTPAAMLGGDWPIHVRNESTGDIIIDPDSSETVDGLATVRIPPGYTATIWCDGTAFRTDLPKTIQRVYDLAGLSTLEYYIEDDIIEERIDLVGVVTSATASIQSRVSLDGSTYPSGGSDYLRSYFGNGGGSSFAGSTNFNSDRLWDLNATSGTSVMASIIYDPGDAGRHATCLMSGSPNVPGNGRSSFVIAGETASNGRWWGVRIYTTSGTFTAGKVVRRSIRS